MIVSSPAPLPRGVAVPTVRFYLAFANQPSSHLPKLAQEADAVRSAVDQAADRGLCARLEARHTRELCQVGDLFKMFLGRADDEVGVLHFAGHGSNTSLDF